MRDLWQVMLETAVTDENQSLTCSECFQMLEYLTELCGVCEDKQALIRSARKHLERCPDCQTYYEVQLKRLEGVVD